MMWISGNNGEVQQVQGTNDSALDWALCDSLGYPVYKDMRICEWCLECIFAGFCSTFFVPKKLQTNRTLTERYILGARLYSKHQENACGMFEKKAFGFLVGEIPWRESVHDCGLWKRCRKRLVQGVNWTDNDIFFGCHRFHFATVSNYLVILLQLCNFVGSWFSWKVWWLGVIPVIVNSPRHAMCS